MDAANAELVKKCFRKPWIQVLSTSCPSMQMDADMIGAELLPFIFEFHGTDS